MLSIEEIERNIEMYEHQKRVLLALKEGKTMTIPRGYTYMFVTEDSTIYRKSDWKNVIEYHVNMDKNLNMWRLPTTVEYERYPADNVMKGGDMTDFTNCDSVNFGGRDRITYASKNGGIYFYDGKRCQTYGDNEHNNAICQDVGNYTSDSCVRKPFVLVRTIKRNVKNLTGNYCKYNIDDLEFHTPEYKYRGHTPNEIAEYINKLNGIEK